MSRFTKEAERFLYDENSKSWFDADADNAPEYVIGEQQPINGNEFGKKLNDAFNKARKEGKPMDAATLMTTGGGALLAYALASSLVDKPDSEKRNDSMWTKVLRSLIPVGAGIAGGVAGHYLGTKMAADENSASKSTAESSSKQDANGDAPVRVERDWIEDYKEAKAKMQLGYAVPATAAGFGAVNRGIHSWRRFNDWYTGGAKFRTDRMGTVIPDAEAIDNLRRRVQAAEQSAADFAKSESNWNALNEQIARENAEGLAKRNAEAARVGKENAIEQANYRNLKKDFDQRYQAWEKSNRKGKPPVPPKQPTPRVVEKFTPKVVPQKPTLTGPTVAAEKALLKRRLGQRALVNGGLSIGLTGLTALSAMLGLSNHEEAEHLRSELRRRVGDDKDFEEYIKKHHGIDL